MVLQHVKMYLLTNTTLLVVHRTSADAYRVMGSTAGCVARDDAASHIARQLDCPQVYSHKPSVWVPHTTTCGRLPTDVGK